MSNLVQQAAHTISDITALPYQTSSDSLFKIISTLNQPTWLDSGKPKSQSGRFDILSANPRKIFYRDDSDNSLAFTNTLNNYLTKNQTYIANTQALPSNPFWGGFIGCLDYSFKHTSFKISRSHATSTTQIGFYEWAIIQDHTLKTCHLIFMRDVPQATRQTIYSVIAPLKSTLPFNMFFSTKGWQHNQSKHQYTLNLKKINDYIHQGDTYQVNYTQRFSSTLSGNPAAAYLTLRKTVPSPFSAYIGLRNHNVLSVSPEQFVGVQPTNNAVNKQQRPVFQAKTQPIKGTAKRSDDPKEDTQRATELINSIKNQSENVMIVDLLRNDFSQNCVPNSVNTPKLFSLESYANVHHLVSTVTGILKPSVSPLSFMIDCFPGGSITGAPKKRAMEIIDELEPHSRQVYCGSIFYASLCGNLDSNITIRTMLHCKKTDKLLCWGGGGIVADSQIDDEYQESIDKVQVFMQAL